MKPFRHSLRLTLLFILASLVITARALVEKEPNYSYATARLLIDQALAPWLEYLDADSAAEVKSLDSASDGYVKTVVDATRDALPAIKAAAPEGLEMKIDFDQSLFVRGAIGSVVVGILFALLFHLVNFAITLFSPTIHVMRLHYVEFFGKFFGGEGKRYTPFRL